MIFLVAMSFVLFAFFVDVSRSLNAHGASLEVAAQAARAAADQVSQESLRTGVPTALRIDPAAAQRAGRAWLAEAGATGSVHVVDGNTAVTVTADVPCRATFLAVFGFGDLSHPATASATLLVGVAGGEGQPIAYRRDPDRGPAPQRPAPGPSTGILLAAAMTATGEPPAKPRPGPATELVGGAAE